MQLQTWRGIPLHPTKLLQYQSALCLVPGEQGSGWNNLGALVSATGVAGRLECGIWTVLQFANEKSPMISHFHPDITITHSMPIAFLWKSASMNFAN